MQKRGALKTQSLETAKAKRDRVESGLGLTPARARSESMSGLLSEVIAAYLKDCRGRDLRPATIRLYTEKLNLICTRLDSPRVADVTNKRLQRWLDSELEHRKAVGVHVDYRVIRSFYRWCVGKKLVSSDPSQDLRFPKITDAPVQPYSDEEVKRLVAAINRPDDYALIIFLILTGCRREEALGLKWDQIDRVRGTILIHGKGGYERFMPLTEAILTALGTLDDSVEYVFAGTRMEGTERVSVGRKSRERVAGRFRIYRDKAGIDPRGSLHRLRHTVGAILTDADYTEIQIGAYLGHSKTGGSVTRRYTSVGPRKMRDMANTLASFLKRQNIALTFVRNVSESNNPLQAKEIK